MPSIERTPPSGRHPKGGWRARYRDPQGRSRRQTFATRAEAQRFVERSGVRIQRAEWVDPELRRTTFDHWAQTWWDTTVHLRPTTRHGYAGALANAAREPYGFLVTFAAYTGLRPSELCGLRVRRLDLLRGTVEVAETLIPINGELLVGPTKNYARRTVPLPRFLRDGAGVYLAGRATALGRPLDGDDYVFPGLRGGPLNRSSFHKWVLQPAVRAAGLPVTLRTHDLRHTCASLLVSLGAHPKAIQERLGHSDIGVTLNVYGHLFPSLEAALTDRLDELHRAAQPVPSNDPAPVVVGIHAAAERRHAVRGSAT